ncbi:hypothetical protein [Streptomyces sp. NPDC002845]
MQRKIQLGEGETERVACASASAFRGLDAVTGEVLGVDVLTGRVGWLTTLVESMCTSVTGVRWNRPDLARLASGQDLSGQRLASNAWTALRMLGWAATAPEGVYVPDQVRRVAEEQAGRALRSAWWRAQITDAVLATWPTGPDADPMRRTEAEWEALRAALPDGQPRCCAPGPGRQPPSGRPMAGCPPTCASWRRRRAAAIRWCWPPLTSSWPRWPAARTTRPATRC